MGKELENYMLVAAKLLDSFEVIVNNHDYDII